MKTDVSAYETIVEFSGERGHAVVVECGQPWRFVFWDKAQYVGCVDLGNGVWFTPEWCEANSPNDLHCYEPIMDKQLRWSRIQILERGPARARVKWTYALNDTRYRIFNGDTRAEEIYTIYPDGVAVREIVYFPGSTSSHGGNSNFWQVGEWILINAAPCGPADVIDTETPFTMSNGFGTSFDLPWPLPSDHPESLCKRYPQIGEWEMYLGRVNLRAMPSPYICIVKDQRLFPFQHSGCCDKPHPNMNLFAGQNGLNIYKHWPVTDMEDFRGWDNAGSSQGKTATHTSFISVNYSKRFDGTGFVQKPDAGMTWYMLVGAQPETAEINLLDNLARSWHIPAHITMLKAAGASALGGGHFLPTEFHRGEMLFEGYDYSIRAYTFRKTAGPDELVVELKPDSVLGLSIIKASQTREQLDDEEELMSSIINPVFVVNGWSSPTAIVQVNGQVLGSDACQTQISGRDLVVWIKGTFDSSVEIKLSVEA